MAIILQVLGAVVSLLRFLISCEAIEAALSVIKRGHF
jgi:hypothetical protein